MLTLRRSERPRKGREIDGVRCLLSARAVEPSLRGRLGAQWIGERTGRRTGGWRRGSGLDELRAVGPLVDEPVAVHAGDAGVVEDSASAAYAGFAVTED